MTKPCILSIAPHADLKPKSKYFEEVGEECINIDGCIELARVTDTPEARTIYRAYRKRLATNDATGLSAEKARENAFFDGLHDLGIRTPMTPIKGDMA